LLKLALLASKPTERHYVTKFSVETVLKLRLSTITCANRTDQNEDISELFKGIVMIALRFFPRNCQTFSQSEGKLVRA